MAPLVLLLDLEASQLIPKFKNLQKLPANQITKARQHAGLSTNISNAF